MSDEVADIVPVSGCEAELGLHLALLDATTLKWRQEIGRVGKEALAWQPAPRMHSIGAIILHIADVEAYWLHEVAAGYARSPEELERLLSEETDQYGCHWPSPPKRPLAWYYAQHDAIRARTHEIVRALDDAGHVAWRGRRAWTLRRLLHHVLHHEAYHGGQAVLLRLLYAGDLERKPTALR